MRSNLRLLVAIAFTLFSGSAGYGLGGETGNAAQSSQIPVAVVTGGGDAATITTPPAQDHLKAAAVAGGRVSNLSVRTTLLAGQNLTVGSVTSGSKSILVRGIGPALNGFGLSNYCPDPKLEIFDGGGRLLESNEGWDSRLLPVFAQLGAFPLPVGSRDTALVRVFSGGSTATLKTVAGGTALIELYDADATTEASAQLLNVSARTRVGSAADPLIAGFVVAGDAARTLLVRGIGPALSGFGVPGALIDPKLTLFSGSKPVFENDNWTPPLSAIFQAAGAFPLAAGSRDAAFAISVPPGSYTAQLSGVGGATGEGLIEVYDITGSTSAAPPAVGAAVPWIRYEAEDGEKAPTAQLMGPNRKAGDPAGDASGRKAVRLSATGDYVQWFVTAPATSLVLRVSIPDAPTGGGISATLGIYKGAVRMQSIPVTSRYAWLYGGDSNIMFTNDPTNGAAHRAYDESQVLLTGSFAAGDIIRIQKDAGDQAAYYDVDFIELENPVELTAPANAISVVSKGATPNDDTDDAAAFVAAISDAKAQGKSVWIPRGVFRLGREINVNGVTIQGAGMWFTELAYTPKTTGDNAPFFIDGGNTTLADFRIRSDDTLRAYSRGIRGSFGTGTTVRNIWVEHATVGIWVGIANAAIRPAGLRVSGCRFRNLYADGINLCNGTIDSIVENCTARNTGDDAFAIWSYSLSGNTRPCTGNVIRNCTAECVWAAAGLAVYGGSNTLESNFVADTSIVAGMTIEAGFSAFPFQGTTVVRNNFLLRCGGPFYGGAEFPSIWILAVDADIAASIDLVNNTVVDSTYSAVIFQCEPGMKITGPVRIDGLTVDGAKEVAWVRGTATGSATLSRISAKNLTQQSPFRNDRPATFTLTTL